MNGGDRFRVVTPCIEVRHSHAAQAERRHYQTLTTQCTLFHTQNTSPRPEVGLAEILTGAGRNWASALVPSGVFSSVSHEASLRHRLFTLGVWVKGADGILEIAGGALLLAAGPGTIGAVVRFLTQRELAEDPQDLVANALRHAVHGLGPHAQLFGTGYLIGHGIVKVGLVAGLLRGKLWSYPAALALLSIFIAYQLYRLTYAYSLPLLLLTAVDVVIVLLIWRESVAVRQRRQPPWRKLG